MGWRVFFDNSSGIIEVIYYGNVNATDLQQAVIERIHLQSNVHSYKILIDASTATLQGTITDMYEVPVSYEKEHANRNTRIAFLLPSIRKERDAVIFFEIASRNRGWNVMTFSSREKAIEWLQK